MSRLIIKNLPVYLSDERLREHFAQRGLITDVKVMARPDGTSRRFGFVGYRTEDEAKEALEYFDRTFIDTSRIQVELAKKIGDDYSKAGPLALKRNSAGAASSLQHSGIFKNTRQRSQRSEDNSRKSAEAAKAPKANAPLFAKGVSFEEFMAVMAPKRKRKIWQNEEEDLEAKLKPDDFEQKNKLRKKKKEQVAASKPQPSASLEHDRAAGLEGKAEAVSDEALYDETLTDLDYMHRRMKRNVAALDASLLAAKQFGQSDSEAEDENASDEDSEIEDEEIQRRLGQERLIFEEKARKDQEAVDTIMSSGRLFVRNLPFAATEGELNVHFVPYGPVKQVHITLDKVTKASKGTAYVSFEDPAHALVAYRAANGSTFQGRLLHLLPAVDLRPKPETPATLKQLRAEERQARADRDFNWGSLYMSADAVATSVADRLGVSKADILNPSDESKGDSAAVRLALAETKVIRETREFLEREGVNVAAFDGGKKPRSDTTILVKNIPYGTAAESIREMFEKHGEVDRVLVPPAGTIALVEMVVAGEARIAFKALAYKRIRNSILYLEKAPEGLIAQREIKTDVTGVKPVTLAKNSSENVPPAGGIGSESDAEAGATLFVKNLSFGTNDAKLAEFFGTLADFAFAKVQTRIDPRDSTASLSMGYGFVGYRSIDAAKTALNALHGKELDGHALALSFARRGQDSDDAPSTKVKAYSTKLVVKNLPFETTKKDLRALFAAHGQLKSVRVPRKAASVAGASGGGARGFAFVEFTSKKEAEAAYESLRHAHFLGRHLVLQWDSEDCRGVEGIRAKVKESFDSVAAQRRDFSGNRARREKLKLGQEDIAEASRRARANRDDVNNE